MSKSNKTLGIIFILLLVIVALMYFTNSGKHERSFRANLVNIDTSKATQITIYPKSHKNEPVELTKESGNWKVRISNNKYVRVPGEKIKNLFRQIIAIKPKRLASREKKQWHSLEVDSTGSRVVINEGSKKSLDIIIGKFSFHQPRSMSTFVRLNNDNDVYEVDGFLAMTFNTKADNFRDGTVIKGNTAEWNKLVFNYPADSSFQIVKVNGKWSADNFKIDSAETAQYLTKLSRISSTQFLDDVDTTKLNNPVYSLTISSENGKPITVSAYMNTKRIIVTSSLNPGTYFDYKNIGKRVFIHPNSLRPKKKKK